MSQTSYSWVLGWNEDYVENIFSCSLLFKLIYCVYGCFAYLNICVPPSCLVTREAKKSMGSRGTGVKGSWEPPCRCWDLNLGSLEEQWSHLSSPSPFTFVWCPVDDRSPFMNLYLSLSISLWCHIFSLGFIVITSSQVLLLLLL